MSFDSVLNYAHKLIAGRVNQGDTVIDATVGNGLDTVFLAKLVGSNGMVFGLDILLCYQFLNQKNDPPFLIAIEKR